MKTTLEPTFENLKKRKKATIQTALLKPLSRLKVSNVYDVKPLYRLLSRFTM